MMSTVSLIGYGRFGKVLTTLLTPTYTVQAYDPNATLDQHGVLVDLDTVLQAKTIFIAVPIRHFERVIQQIAPRLSPGTLIIDVCSVKVFPVQVMQQLLPDHVDIIATHPLFGPDSNTSSHRKMMIHPVRDQQQQYQHWLSFFAAQGLTMLEMTPDEHDRFAAESQGVTHFLGRALAAAEFKPTPIDTLGYDKLLSIIEQTCNDTWELFCDLQNYNPYTNDMTQRLQQSIDQIKQQVQKNNTPPQD